MSIMPLHELIPYMTLVLVFALTPGPNMMLYLTYTFEYVRTAGWATAAGVLRSFVLHVAAVSFGLTALLLAHPKVLDIVRYCGIAYLLYLAYKNLKTVPWKEAGIPKPELKLRRFYTDGFIGNMLNPGSWMLYFSILPQFVHPDRGSVWKQNLVLGGLQMLGSFTTNCLVVFFAGYATDFFFRNEKYQQWLRYGMSSLIVLFAVKLLFFRVG